MRWKERPYWLKGGVILACFDAILLALIHSFGGRDGVPIFLFFTQPILFWFRSLNQDSATLQLLLISLEGLVGYFIIGCVFGWIYGKIKGSSK